MLLFIISASVPPTTPAPPTTETIHKEIPDKLDLNNSVYGFHPTYTLADKGIYFSVKLS